MNKSYDIFKALGEENRFRITALLVKAGKEICACEIIDALQKPQYTISKSMGGLVQAGIAEERRDGKMMFYRLMSEKSDVASLLDTVRIISASKTYAWKDDFTKLASRLSTRAAGKCVKGCS
jgi:ArsR family transcriptional regulator, arsenate/arsenite/antimonite-responsive transcriptional repressor